MKNRPFADQERIAHILEAIGLIEEFIQDVDRNVFLQNKQIQSAVLYQFLIIGEAVASLSLELTDQYPYHWYKPKAFRNFIAHEYFGIKMWVVWNTVIHEIPKLKSVLLSIQSALTID